MVDDVSRTTALTKQNLHDAIYGQGPLAFAWQDKPHRLLIDAAEQIERMEAELTEDREAVAYRRGRHDVLTSAVVSAVVSVIVSAFWIWVLS